MRADDEALTPDEIALADRLESLENALVSGRDPSHDSDAAPAKLRPQLDGGLDVLRRLDDLRRVMGTTPATATVADPVAPGGRFGRFLVRRLIGRGGFGSVFLAFDPLLGREIALKVPHAEALVSPELRERFKREAQASAALDHPNLVSVYEAGEIGPICYLVSAYCPAGNLAEFLTAQNHPISAGDAANLVAQLSEGVQHAHERGVLHRDLKPANVLLMATTESNQGGINDFQPKITDFGLAKLLDTESGLTRTGIVVGTPQYMAPEQTTGKDSASGAATDIYSLGVILYEALVGRPPFLAESALETLQQVRELEPVSPRRLRPIIPRDLDTICLKCLQKEPGRRYASAAALADDLHRFLDHKPIAARPVSAMERAVRWSRRHPLTAALAVALSVSLLGGLSAVFWQWGRAKILAEQNGIERDRAEKNYARAKAVVERLSRLGTEMSGKPGMNKTRQAVYEEILSYYTEVLDERSADPRVRRDAAKAALQLAIIRRSLGQYELAEKAFANSSTLYEQLLAEDPANLELRAEQLECWRWHAHLLRTTAGPEAARAEYERAIAGFEALCAEYPNNYRFEALLANTWLNWSSQWPGGTSDGTVKGLNKALEIDRRLLNARPNDRVLRSEYGLILSDLGMVRFRQRRMADAEAHFRESVDLLRKVFEEGPTHAGNQLYLARNLERLGTVCMNTNRTSEALPYFEESYTLCDRLTHDHPDVPEYSAACVMSCNWKATTLQRLGRWFDAIEPRRRVLAEQLRHVNLAPELPDVRKQNPVHRRYLGVALTEVDQHGEAIGHLRTALSENPDDSAAIHELAWTLATAADAAVQSPAEAVALAEQAVGIAANRGHYWSTLGAARFYAKDLDGAVVALEKATELNKGERAVDWCLLALAHTRLGQRDRAVTAFGKAAEEPTASPLAQRLRAEAVAAIKDK